MHKGVTPGVLKVVDCPPALVSLRTWRVRLSGAQRHVPGQRQN